MSQEKMYELADKLADEFIATKPMRREFTAEWTIKESPEDQIVVIVAIRKKSDVALIEKAIKAVGGPFSGPQQCPMCKGTGSI